MFSWSLVHPYHNWRTEEYSHNFIDICFIIPYNKVAVRGRVRGGARGIAEEVQPWSTPQDVRVSCRATIASSRVCVGATLLMSSLQVHGQLKEGQTFLERVLAARPSRSLSLLLSALAM